MQPISALRLTLLALLVVVAGACTPPTAIAPESPSEEPAGSDPAALAEARARWDAAGLTAYAFTYEESCFCPPEFRGPFRIAVENGAVASVTREGAPATTQRSYPTVETLFDTIAEAYDRDAETVRVTYDPALGLPVNVYIDYEAMMADEELGFTVTRFTR